MPKSPNYLIFRPDVTTFRTLRLTDHAKQRLEERKIQGNWANAVAAFGTWSLSYRCRLLGNEAIFRRPDASNYIRTVTGCSFDKEELACLGDLVVVVSADGRTIVTAFYKTKE